MLERRVQISRVDEFTASLLLELVEAEMERLKAAQDGCRDAFDPMGWARIKVATHGLNDVWCALHRGVRDLGEPPVEVVEDRQHTLRALSHSMPRSKANSAAWRRAKAEEKAHREALRARSKRRAW